MDKETPMNPEYVGEMTPEEEAEWKVVDMQNEAREAVKAAPDETTESL